MRLLAALLAVVAFALPAHSEDERAPFTIGGDAFHAGLTVLHDGPEVDDLFMAGETVRAETAVSGSVYLAGRRVTVAGAVGGDAHAAGAELRLEGPVGGDVTAAGGTLRLGAVGGDLRATGDEIVLSGPVGGYALISGNRVEILGVIAGDAAIEARELVLGPEARIEGVLTLFEPAAKALDVPEATAPPERIERRAATDWQDEIGAPAPVMGPARQVGGFLGGVLVVALVAALLAGLMPETLAAMRERIAGRPFSSLGLGFLALSVLAGSTILFALTLVGLLLTPATLLIAVVAGLVGYVVGAYTLGVSLVGLVRPGRLVSFGERALAGLVGALGAGLAGLVPVLGWIFGLALALAGVGALTARAFARRLGEGQAPPLS